MEIARRVITLPDPSRRFVIRPFACTHWDSPYCDTDLFQRFVASSLAPDVWTVGVGDYLDFARATKRSALRQALPGDDDTGELLDSLVATRLQEYMRVIAPLRHRLLGLVEGNHHYEFCTTSPDPNGWRAGETSTSYMARRLGVPYLAWLGLIIIEVRIRGVPDFADTIRILASHGYGTTAQSVGADLNRMERYLGPAFRTDIIVTAHTHRRVAYCVPVMEPSETGFRERSVVLIKAGAFLKAYVPGRSSYAEQRFKAPLDLGWVDIDIRYRLTGGKAYRLIRLVQASRMEITQATATDGVAGAEVEGGAPIASK
jgi:hypothetical protein